MKEGKQIANLFSMFKDSVLFKVIGGKGYMFANIIREY